MREVVVKLDSIKTLLLQIPLQENICDKVNDRFELIEMWLKEQNNDAYYRITGTLKRPFIFSNEFNKEQRLDIVIEYTESLEEYLYTIKESNFIATKVWSLIVEIVYFLKKELENHKTIVTKSESIPVVQ